LRNADKYSSTKYLCQSETATLYCSSKKKGMDCFNVSLSKLDKHWQKAAKNERNSQSKNAYDQLHASKDYKTLLLAAYQSQQKPKKSIALSSEPRIVTGKYARVTLKKKGLFPKCLPEMLYAAYVLQSTFSEYNFEIDGKISACKKIRQAAHRLSSH